MHWMTSNQLEHLMVNSILHILSKHIEVQIVVSFALWPAVFNVVENRKSTKWPQTDLKCQTYPVYICPIFLLYAHPFSRHKAVENRKKIGNAPNNLRLTWTLNNWKYCLCNEYLPTGLKLWYISLYDQPLSNTRLLKIGNAPNDLKMTLNI